MTRGSLKGLLYGVTRWFCRPLTVVGKRHVPNRAVVFVANHSSHADTAALLAALPAATRRDLSPAAAEDYFFKTRLRGMLIRAATGAFPFPRHGSDGIERAWALVGVGHSVLMFPEGTRSRNGSVGQFRCGIGILAQRGATVVPVGIAGTGEILAKGTKLPRRGSVAVVFGEPRSFMPNDAPDEIAQTLRDEVRVLASEAKSAVSSEKPTFYERARRFATSRAALWFVFGWSIAEAMWWPVIPDFLVAPLALAAPSRWLILAAVATGGSVLGGAIAFHLGAVTDWFISTAPLLTPRMHEQAVAWMTESGPGGLLQQPLSGIPYKVFALRAADAEFSFPAFVAISVAARGWRIAAVAAIFAGGGAALQRLWPRLFGVFLIAYCVVFAFGLSATVESWK